MSKTRKALLMLLALAAVTGPLRLLLAALLPDSSIDPVPQCIGGMIVSVVLLGLPAWWLRPWTSPRLLRAKAIWPSVMMAVAVALLARAAMSPVDAGWQRMLDLRAAALPLPESVPVAMLCLAALVIVPALTEEVFFRGTLLTSLLDGGDRVSAALLTTVSFALLHGNLANVPSLLVLSLLLTQLMLHSGCIAVPVTAHLVYNLTALQWRGIPGWGSLLCGAGLIGLSVYLDARQPSIAHPKMMWADRGIAFAAIAIMILSYLI